MKYLKKHFIKLIFFIALIVVTTGTYKCFTSKGIYEKFSWGGVVGLVFAIGLFFLIGDMAETYEVTRKWDREKKEDDWNRLENLFKKYGGKR